ncbi:uncharacterized protein N7506_008788 [Penicillium brevicompactum]|uniref:uncharacterized protein n=1 Tax=Penicillium brevicompactum TaxID=5074 RepID=UPI00253F9C3D|nr:uncharacterized protein N7506_008788 [Penicillium brevicompactum]KAJ5325686.1 hypothetical protein N7506_008788 [Penicillium brevicompactum]
MDRLLLGLGWTLFGSGTLDVWLYIYTCWGAYFLDVQEIAIYSYVVYRKTKHIAVKFHKIREEILARRVKLRYILTYEMVVDGLTKLFVKT